MGKGGAALGATDGLTGGMEDWFDFDGYFDEIPKKEQPFAQKLSNTQMFAVLVQHTVEASQVRLAFHLSPCKGFKLSCSTSAIPTAIQTYLCLG